MASDPKSFSLYSATACGVSRYAFRCRKPRFVFKGSVKEKKYKCYQNITYYKILSLKPKITELNTFKSF